ncbi:MAG: PEGA domain-containing protein [Candidatus Omnitrophota bacterium]|nr:PEGA domain-containing protein [Candidatus Omnitrophota bacterium]
MLSLRKIIFYIFAAIYVFLCPVLILYAFGYLYKPGPFGGIVKTGLISLSTAPNSASVYINGRKYTDKTPTVIRELLPGDYAVKIKLNGYRDWEHAVKVEEEKAVVFKNILLLPEVWKQEISVPGKFTKMIVLPGTDLMILSESDELGAHIVYDRIRGKRLSLLNKKSILKNLKYRSSFTSEGDNSILVRADNVKGEKYLWFQILPGKNMVKDVTALFPVAPSDVKWISGHSDYAFSLQDKYLNRVDVAAGAVYPRYIEKVKGYGLFGGDIYIVGMDNTFTKMDFDRSDEEVVVKTNDTAALIFNGESYYDVTIPEKDLILFLGDRGELLVNKLPYRFVGNGVLGMKLYQDEKKILIWEKNKIGILDLNEERNGSVEFEKGPSVNWVYTQGRDIRQCFLIYDDSHVLFMDGKTLFILPVDGDDDGGASKVFTMQEKGCVDYSEDTGRVYFVLNSGSGLTEAEIVPKYSILRITEDRRQKSDKY